MKLELIESMSKMETERMDTERLETGPDLGTGPTAKAATRPATPRTTTLFVGISGVVDIEQLRAHAGELAASGAVGNAHLTLAYPGADTTSTLVTETVELLSYPLPTAEASSSPFAQTAAAESALLALAAEAQATVLLHADLAALTSASLMQLAAPVLAREADLVMASYTQGPFDSLLNHSILAPLNRALYGKRVRYPLAPDFALSPRMVARLAVSAQNAGSNAAPVLWPSTVAAGIDASIFEAQLPIQHPTPAGSMELSAVIAQLVGSCFAEMEIHAPLWQRVRAVQPPLPRAAAIPVAAAAEAQGIDTASMINSFLLGSRSLQDVWGMLLPPVTLLDLKRLTASSPDKFRVPDELWVRIIYDFALGFRLRTINRTHLLGALTPLYLGWVASFVNEVAGNAAFDAEARTERLARAFEDGKPYLMRRWRWPDRFNP